jgi:predicted aminopeptidase
MSHATIFVKDSVDFNENLATFIGDRGAERFLIQKYGINSRAYTTYINEDKDYLRFVDHMLRASGALDSLYNTLHEADPFEKKQAAKEALIRKIVATMDTLSLALTTTPSARFKDKLPNNAYFMNYRQYQSQQDVFWNEWNTTYPGDLKGYIRYLSRKYPFL